MPWIALSLAGTWTGYGVMKEEISPWSGGWLTGETLLLLPLAALLVWRTYTGEGALGHVDVTRHILLLCVGTVTAVPLLLFAHGARSIRMTTLGLLQYISPTVQFFIGLLVYREPFDSAQFQAFALIWCGLALYSTDSFWTQRRLLLKASGVA